MNRDKKKSRQQQKKRREGCRNTTTSCFILLIRWVWCTSSSIDCRMKVTQGYVAPQRANSFWRTVGHQIISVCNPRHDTRRMVSFAAQRVLIFGEPTMTPMHHLHNPPFMDLNSSANMTTRIKVWVISLAFEGHLKYSRSVSTYYQPSMDVTQNHGYLLVSHHSACCTSRSLW